MIVYIKIYVVFSIFFIFTKLPGSWLERKAEGWCWYEDKERIEDEEVEIPKIPVITATEKMTAIRKELEESLNKAILEPTKENVMIYMNMQQKWMNQSALFSQVWIKNLLLYPHLDTRIASPITQYGVQMQKEIIREKKEKLIHSLTHTYGLFFFYFGNDKISQAFSFVVKEFANKYAWQVFAISCDGNIIEGFENNAFNQKMTQRLNVTQFPSLYLVEPKQQIAIPIAFGLSTMDQIEDNIELQLSKEVQ